MTNGLNKWGRLNDNTTDQEDPDPWADSSSIGDVNGVKYPADLIRNMHQRSDVDSATFAQHHTLGLGRNNAARGDHTHNGIDSKAISSGIWVPISAQAMWTSLVNPQPSIGAAASYAAYYKNGTYVTVKWSINPDATTTFGTGDWVFSLPFPAAHFIGWQVVGVMNGTISTNYMSSAAILVTAAVVKIINQGSAIFWGATTPVTWNSSGYLSLEFTYESTS